MSRGRKLFAGVATSLLGFELPLFGLQFLAGSPAALESVGRITAEILLLAGIWRGSRLASGVLGACFVCIVPLAALFVIVRDLHPWTADAVIGIWSAILAAWGVVLFRSASLRAYMEHQRS